MSDPRPLVEKFAGFPFLVIVDDKECVIGMHLQIGVDSYAELDESDQARSKKVLAMMKEYSTYMERWKPASWHANWAMILSFILRIALVFLPDQETAKRLDAAAEVTGSLLLLAVLAFFIGRRNRLSAIKKVPGVLLHEVV